MLQTRFLVVSVKKWTVSRAELALLGLANRMDREGSSLGPYESCMVALYREASVPGAPVVPTIRHCVTIVYGLSREKHVKVMAF